MRKLKFRAWSKERNEMYYKDMGINFQGEKLVCLFTNPLNSPIKEQIGYTIANKIENEDLILMQYTGLKDKQGKEIYEGDIILSKYFDERIDKWVKRKAIIIFEDGCFMFQGTKNKYWISPLINIIGDTWTIEVIGNIHENSELLDNKKEVKK